MRSAWIAAVPALAIFIPTSASAEPVITPDCWWHIEHWHCGNQIVYAPGPDATTTTTSTQPPTTTTIPELTTTTTTEAPPTPTTTQEPSTTTTEPATTTTSEPQSPVAQSQTTTTSVAKRTGTAQPASLDTIFTTTTVTTTTTITTTIPIVESVPTTRRHPYQADGTTPQTVTAVAAAILVVMPQLSPGAQSRKRKK